MELFNKLILLAILGAVVAFLLFLARRARREKMAAPPVQDTLPEVPSDLKVAAVVIEEPVVVKLDPAVVTVAPSPVEVIVAPIPVVEPAPLPPVIAPLVKRKKKRPILMPSAAIAPKATPIETVLGLLKEKESLAAAFLLREILDAPVSLRRLRRSERQAPRGR